MSVKVLTEVEVRGCVCVFVLFCTGMYNLAAVIFLLIKFMLVCNEEGAEQPGQMELK